MPNTFLGIPLLGWLIICFALIMLVIVGIAATTPKRYTKASWLREAKKLKPNKPIQCFQCRMWLFAKNAKRHLLTRCPATPTEEKKSGEPLNLTPGKTYRIDL